MKQNTKTAEFLNLLEYAGSIFGRPTLQNLTGGYENWEFRHGRIPRFRHLEKFKLIERVPSIVDERIFRLTQQGRRTILGGRDPEAFWNRKWDGHWRLAMFDVPTGKERMRSRLRRYLQAQNFGWLQKSVWITPSDIGEITRLIDGDTVNSSYLTFMKAQACAGETDQDIVTAAWDFQKINQGYKHYLGTLENEISSKISEENREQLLDRVNLERSAWAAAVLNDPLLPRSLWPANYLGENAWLKRKAWRKKTAKAFGCVWERVK
jgi:DNA-binding transcriptional regulator PaaX